MTITDSYPNADDLLHHRRKYATTSSTVYSGTITVSASMTMQAIASASGFAISQVLASAVYIINLPADTPAFSPVAGTYATAQTVTISDGTPGATIYYTTNGFTPTTSSTGL